MWTLVEIVFWAMLAYSAPRPAFMSQYARPTALIMTASCCIGFMLNELVYPITRVEWGVDNLLFVAGIDFTWAIIFLGTSFIFTWQGMGSLYRAKHLAVVYIIAIGIRLLTYDAIIKELPGTGYRDYFVWANYRELLIATDVLAMIIFLPEIVLMGGLAWSKLYGKESPPSYHS